MWEISVKYAELTKIKSAIPIQIIIQSLHALFSVTRDFPFVEKMNEVLYFFSFHVSRLLFVEHKEAHFSR